jgi:hypothetical protein
LWPEKTAILGKFRRVSQSKVLVYFMAILSILWPFDLHILWPFDLFYGHLIYIFYGHLIYFMAIWSILWPFDLFYGYLVILWSFGIFFTIWHMFSPFGYIVPWKNLATLVFKRGACEFDSINLNCCFKISQASNVSEPQLANQGDQIGSLFT